MITFFTAILLCLTLMVLTVGAHEGDASTYAVGPAGPCKYCGSMRATYDKYDTWKFDGQLYSTPLYCYYYRYITGLFVCQVCGSMYYTYYEDYSQHPTLIYNESTGRYECPACDYSHS